MWGGAEPTLVDAPEAASSAALAGAAVAVGAAAMMGAVRGAPYHDPVPEEADSAPAGAGAATAAEGALEPTASAATLAMAALLMAANLNTEGFAGAAGAAASSCSAPPSGATAKDLANPTAPAKVLIKAGRVRLGPPVPLDPGSPSGAIFAIAADLAAIPSDTAPVTVFQAMLLVDGKRSISACRSKCEVHSR